jgi:hypothetical protein
MSFSATAIGELLRRHYPKAEGVIKAMIEAIQFQRTQGIKITDVDIINRVISLRSKVKVDDEETNAQLDISSGYPTYIPATEPDYDKTKLYLFLDHVADIYKDYSGFGNHATLSYLYSTPDVDTDGLDLGNGHDSRALKFDRNKNTVLIVKDASNIRIAGLTTGFSLVMRIRYEDLLTDNGKTGRLYIKYDDANNHVMIFVNSDGKVEVHVRIAGVTTDWVTTTTPIAIGNWYTLEIVYSVSGPAVTIYVDGVSQATTTGSPRSISNQTTDLIMGSYDVDSFKTFTGIDDFISQSHSASLSLSQMTLRCKFRTKAHPSGSNTMYMISKGNYITETAGQNLNYSLIMLKNGKISFGFEDSAGVDKFAVSPLSYNDGLWHEAVGTFDASDQAIKLYIDGVLKATFNTTAVPDTNTLSLYIGAATPGTTQEWAGDLDDIIIWNNDLTAAEILDMAEDGTIPQTGAIVYEQNFGARGLHSGGRLVGNIQWVLFQRDQLDTATEALAFHNNKWTKNPNVGSNKVATVFYTLATTP